MRRGLSLTEIVVVLCILGLLASGSLLLLSKPLQNAKANARIEEMQSFLRWAHQTSQRSKGELTFDLNQQIVGFQSRQGREKTLSLGTAVHLNALLVDGAVIEDNANIALSQGGSRSYALELVRNDRRGLGENSGVWLLVCGPTGMIEEYGSTPENKDTLRQLLAQWANAD